ncbi:MAG: class I SAM-dependent methyltransferase [Solirubrobacteraceae bacterium]
MVDTELKAMLTHDERHWWYQGRRRILRAALSRLKLPGDAELLDAGCGSGRTLDELAAFGRLTGVDVSPAAVAAARARGHRHVLVAEVERLPLGTGEFDLVTCLDVLEHTADDGRTLRELHRVTRPGGHLLLTVPAYPSLWSYHDVANCHFRRYRRASLLHATLAAGWTTVSITHFNAAPLAPAALVRIARRLRARSDTRSDLERTPPWLNGLLGMPSRLESDLVRRGVPIPAGLSLLAVLRNDKPLPLRASLSPHHNTHERNLPWHAMPLHPAA